MHADSFVQELDALNAERLAPILAAGQTSLQGPMTGDTRAMLQIALANEINVAELAAAWMPSTPEAEVKIAFARQCGDEAGHFELVAERLRALGFEPDASRPAANPLFDYLRGLSTTVERLAAGLYTLESIAHGVNENFIAYCSRRGDDQTVRIYRNIIQPDEQRHHDLGRELLARYANGATAQARAREVVAHVLWIAGEARAQAAARVGSACVPGC